MSKQTDKSLFIVSSVPRFYQALLSGIEGYKELGNRIIREVKVDHAFRQVEKVRELSRILVNIPVKEYQLIAHYYLAWCECREGKYNSEVLEKVIEQTQTYKAKGLSSRAAFEGYKGNAESEFYFYKEALKASPSITEYIDISRSIAVVKAKEGFNKSALEDLEKLIQLIQYAEPLVCYDFLNSYAVELGEAGHKDEARNISNRVLASAFAPAYPEWQETAQVLREPNRSFISIPRSIPKIEHKHVEIGAEPLPTKKERNPADVLPFNKLKEAPIPDKPERVSNIDLDDMTDSQKLDFIMTALRTGAIKPSRYNDIIYQSGMLKTGPSSKVLDLEDETIMTDKLIEWAHMIDPDDLAGVISLLRDCDDQLRQINLMDAMIRKLFEYSSECGASEEAWRKKVERRLPKK